MYPFRPCGIRSSTSHPHLGFTNGGSRNTVSRGGPQTYDQGTQTPQNITRETRRSKLSSLKLPFSAVTPPSINLNLRYVVFRNESCLYKKLISFSL